MNLFSPHVRSLVLRLVCKSRWSWVFSAVVLKAFKVYHFPLIKLKLKRAITSS